MGAQAGEGRVRWGSGGRRLAHRAGGCRQGGVRRARRAGKFKVRLVRACRLDGQRAQRVHPYAYRLGGSTGSCGGRCGKGPIHPPGKRPSPRPALTGAAARLPPPLPDFLRFRPRPGRPELPVSWPSKAGCPPAPPSSSSSSSSSSCSTSSSDMGAESGAGRMPSAPLVSRTWLATSCSPSGTASGGSSNPPSCSCSGWPC